MNALYITALRPDAEASERGEFADADNGVNLFAATTGAIEREANLVRVLIGSQYFYVTPQDAQQVAPSRDDFFAQQIRSGKF